MNDPLEKVLIEPAAVARVLGCKPSTLRVRRWREPDSKPRWVKIGGRVMYPRKEVVSYPSLLLSNLLCAVFARCLTQAAHAV
jgi:hypothetical protein